MLNNDWLFTVASLGTINNQLWRALGSGVFIFDHPFVWFVTANHILKSNGRDSMHILIKHKKQKQVFININEIQKRNDLYWVIDEENDIAATLFPMDSNFQLKAVSFEFFLNFDKIARSIKCYSIGCPYGVIGFDIENVIENISVLDGIVSFKSEKRNRIYVTVPTFPGNSGGPLIVWEEAVKADGSLKIAGSPIKLGGIIIEYMFIADPENGLPPFHLGIVVPADAIRNLIGCKEALAQKKSLLSK